VYEVESHIGVPPEQSLFVRHTWHDPSLLHFGFVESLSLQSLSWVQALQTFEVHIGIVAVVHWLLDVQATHLPEFEPDVSQYWPAAPVKLVQSLLVLQGPHVFPAIQIGFALVAVQKLFALHWTQFPEDPHAGVDPLQSLFFEKTI